jgi:DNA-binding NtrC family response regulator
MMSFNSGPLLHFADLPTGVVNFTRSQTAEGFVSAAVGGRTIVLPQQDVVPLQELEKRAIQHALLHTRGDRTTAAQMLGIGRTTLYRKLKEYQLD